MSELRRQNEGKEWIIVSPDRSTRPLEFPRVQHEASVSSDTCPFCAGNEGMTPPELYRDPSEQTESWRVRVIPNKFPALNVDPRLDPIEFPASHYARLAGSGSHEVIVESPDHGSTFESMSEDQAVRVIAAYVARVRHHLADPRFPYVQLFKNHGGAAGASLRHPHSQIIALPFVPDRIQRMVDAEDAHFARNESCQLCEIIENESRLGLRVVHHAEGFLVWAPFDSRFPYELTVAPCEHLPDFSDIEQKHQLGLARALGEAIRRLECTLGDVPYNFFLFTSPRRAAPPGTSHPGVHWRLSIVPRIGTLAGFEFATGVHINPVSPVAAAKRLRDNDTGKATPDASTGGTHDPLQ